MIGPRKVEKPLVLYGYGRLGHLAEEIFGELGISVSAVFEKEGMVKGILLPEKIMQIKFLLAICVASEPYEKVIAPLKAAGWTDIVPVWDVIEAYPETGLGNGWKADPINDEDVENVVAVVGKLDFFSLIHYGAFLQWRKGGYWGEKYSLEPIPSLPSTLADIRKRQRVEQYIFEGYPIKPVDIHNEGCELKTLELNIDRFGKYRPKITVACYHSRDGLWKIPKFLMDNLEDYNFTFRCHAYMGQAAYIYCTPRERRGE